MAIQGDYIWDTSKYQIGDPAKGSTFDLTGTADVSGSGITTDWDERVAVRWSEMLGYTPQTFKPLVAGLSQADKENLLRPGYYPEISGGAVVVKADGMFPNIINHRGEFRSPDGVLGLPELNEFAGAAKSIADPAV